MGTIPGDGPPVAMGFDLKHRSDMSSASPVRSMRRRLNTGIMWAMIPLAALGGVPTARCICIDCPCRTDCSTAVGSPVNHSTISSSGSIEHTAACCREHSTGNAQRHSCTTGKGLGCQSSDGCRKLVSAAPAVRTAGIEQSDRQPSISEVVDSIRSVPTVRSVNLRTPADTGPPPDLVVTLQRLVI
jgi:hypothetical protein